ncbi:hypothetical protein N7G274_000070 [Stereocaulon virgatum]|uniref:Magnesium chelatase n=1 Tax=Stereocaulon virgatum TaxID=373712 RepID=A0ABR4ARM7_9LECA
MDTSELVDKIQELTDLELAVLVCLVTSQHCIIQTEEDGLDPLEQELRLVASNIFGLSYTVVHCNNSSTLEDFSAGILVEGSMPDIEHEDSGMTIDSKHDSLRRSRSNSPVKYESGREAQGIANIVIVSGLTMACQEIQIQALELLRTRRIFIHTAIHAAPKMFLLVFLDGVGAPRLVHHLIDHVFISHYHDQEDGFANLEELSEETEDDRASLSSVLHRSEMPNSLFANQRAFFSQEEVRTLIDLSQTVSVSAEVKAYLQNIVTFLRMHRAVGGGISPRATQHFDLLVKCLAPLHGLAFVTPSLVSLATRKIYPHRIKIISAENDRSMQYGSDLAAVASILDGLRPEDVIDDVLQQVEAPL